MRYIIRINGKLFKQYESMGEVTEDIAPHVTLVHDVELEDTYLDTRYRVLPAKAGPGLRIEKKD